MDNRGTLYVVDENGGGIVILGRDGSYMGRQLSLGWNEGLLILSFPDMSQRKRRGFYCRPGQQPSPDIYSGKIKT